MGLHLVSAELWRLTCLFFFFFNDTATTEIYTLSLHDALPISGAVGLRRAAGERQRQGSRRAFRGRSEEHTSELQSPCNLVCRLLLEKKKSIIPERTPISIAKRAASRLSSLTRSAVSSCLLYAC